MENNRGRTAALQKVQTKMQLKRFKKLVIVLSLSALFTVSAVRCQDRKPAAGDVRAGTKQMNPAAAEAEKNKPVNEEISESNPVKAPSYEEKILGESVQGRQIKSVTFNRKDCEPAFIFSGIHGDEKAALELGDRLYKRWTENPEVLAGEHVIYIPLANPDGSEKGTRQNANKVDLNRNFPDAWKPGKIGNPHYPGTEPLSEPEAKIIARLVENENPRMIISIHSCRWCGGMNNYDGPAGEWAKLMKEYNGYKASSEWTSPTPGSFGTFAGKAREIPTITLELPKVVKTESKWQANIKAVEEAIKYRQTQGK